MPLKKGRKKTGGRQKGVPNKSTTEIRELRTMIREALDRSGGIDYLTIQARDNPKAFLTLLSKILPMEVNNNVSGSVKAQVTVKLV